MSGVEKQIPFLLKELCKDTVFSSSLTDRQEHWAYKEIVAWGKVGILYLLESILKNPSWGALMALSEVAEEIVIPDNLCGRFYGITHLWLKWGYANGYISLHSSMNRIKDS